MFLIMSIQNPVAVRKGVRPLAAAIEKTAMRDEIAEPIIVEIGTAIQPLEPTLCHDLICKVNKH